MDDEFIKASAMQDANVTAKSIQNNASLDATSSAPVVNPDVVKRPSNFQDFSFGASRGTVVDKVVLDELDSATPRRKTRKNAKPPGDGDGDELENLKKGMLSNLESAQKAAGGLFAT